MNWIIIVLVIFGCFNLAFFITWLRRLIKRQFRKNEWTDYLDSLEHVNINPTTPNFIIILTDDMGYQDISCFGAKTVHTPHIAALAGEGVTFTNFYSCSPICSPSRAGLLTGRYPVRTHVPTVFFPKKSIFSLLSFLFTYSYGVKGISKDEITIPEALKKACYATGMLGKWHLGDKSPHLPNDKGVDFFYGAFYSNNMKPYEI